MYLDTEERQAAASTQQQQAEFPPCCGQWVVASGNSWQIMIRLTVVIASWRLVQT